MSIIQMDFANAKFLIYNKWSTKSEYNLAGSLLIDCALTEEEAIEKVQMYKRKHDEFHSSHPLLYNNTETSIVYIVNQENWWTNRKAPLG